jgi:hypothetical protein
MYDTTQAIKIAYKPFDIVDDKHGNVGFIQEVSINDREKNTQCQISYVVIWLYGKGLKNLKHAWWEHGELKRHCNLFVKIAKAACHPFNHNDIYVSRLLGK